MKITEVDIIPIHPRLASRYEGLEARFVSITDRTVFRVRTDHGLVGYGALLGALAGRVDPPLDSQGGRRANLARIFHLALSDDFPCGGLSGLCAACGHTPKACAA